MEGDDKVSRLQLRVEGRDDDSVVLEVVGS